MSESKTASVDPAILEQAIEEAEIALDLAFSGSARGVTTRMFAEIAVQAAVTVLMPATSAPPVPRETPQ